MVLSRPRSLHEQFRSELCNGAYQLEQKDNLDLPTGKPQKLWTTTPGNTLWHALADCRTSRWPATRIERMSPRGSLNALLLVEGLRYGLAP
jgi:hypothetical protein